VPRQTDLLPARRRPSTWAWLVTGSAVVVAGCALALFAWWLASSRTNVTTYSVRGSVSGITLDLGNADAEIVGGGDRPAVEIRRTDRYAFGRRATGTRRAAGGVLVIGSRCPRTLLDVCSATYRLTVPDNVRVTVRTSSGDVRFTGYRGSADVDTGTGDIAIGGFCGFGLRARAQSGDVSATASCALERLELRSRTGNVRAVVPPGRYQLDADSDVGRRTVRGVTAADDAPFLIQALSSQGDVTVETSG
jgi:Putative adhesin